MNSMLKTGLFLPGHCPQRDRQDRRLALLLAASFLVVGLVAATALLALAFSL